MHQGISGEIARQALLQVVVRLSHALVLTQMFCPGMHQEYLQIALRNFGVTEESPSISTVAASYPAVSMYALNELRHPFCNDRVFHRNHYGALAKVRLCLVDNHRHAPVVPRSQIGGRVGKLREKGEDSGCERSNPGGHESNPYA